MSPYNYAAGNPINIFDPNGSSIFASTELHQEYVLDQIRDQLGGNVFNFDKEGYMNYSAKAFENAREKIWTADQIKIANRLVTTIKANAIIEVLTFENENINFSRIPHSSAIIPDDNNIFKAFHSRPQDERKVGRYSIDKLDGAAITVSFGNIGVDDRAFILINKAAAKTASFSSVEGGLTAPCESAIFFHELFDEGWGYISSGAPGQYEGHYNINAVEYMNAALRNCGVFERNGMDHGKFKNQYLKQDKEHEK